jgi:thioredoxin reductase (NADPH)
MTATVPLTVAPREEQVFPVLTPAQIARLETHGNRRTVQRGEVLIEAGAQHYPLMVVLSGELEAVRNSCAGEELATTHRQGQFSGELNLVTGRRGLATIRATEPGEVLAVERESFLGLLQTDAELSEIFMRAFILRRVVLIDRGFGDVVVLGSQYSSRTLEVREFLSRNAHP